MQSNCILDSVANLLVRHMVFVGNVQKTPIASHLTGLHQLNLRSKRDVLVPPYDLQSRMSCCCLVILERISGFDPSLEMIAQVI